MKNRILRKLVKLTPILLVSIFIGMQFVPAPAVPKTLTPRPHTAEMIDPQIGKILDRSCQDCHSNRTAWPWYSHVAPASWLVTHDVNDGRRHMNFSTWNRMAPDKQASRLRDAWEEIESGGMPLWYYLPLHSAARLSDADKQLLHGWIQSTSGR